MGAFPAPVPHRRCAATRGRSVRRGYRRTRADARRTGSSVAGAASAHPRRRRGGRADLRRRRHRRPPRCGTGERRAASPGSRSRGAAPGPPDASSPGHRRQGRRRSPGSVDDQVYVTSSTEARVQVVSVARPGGGLPVAYAPDAPDFDLARWRDGLDQIKAAYPRYGLVIEPGRYLVAESGVLLLTVTQVVDKDGIRRVGCDAGMNALMRPAMYDAYHGIHNLSRLGDDEAMARFDIVGPICESSDVLGRGRSLPAATGEGDVLLVADAGAYGMVMAHTYNQRALPAEDVM
ncbi:MAG: hypothetical protein KY442_09115 [Proteobacteria bacterium]|nr:hypothetical protein [Pseudomonadota bacterium]